LNRGVGVGQEKAGHGAKVQTEGKRIHLAEPS